MQPEQWNTVDRYICDSLVPPDPVLDGALRFCAELGLPAIHISPNQGKLLHILARSINARNILEIGTLGGYSAIWLARALPIGGRLVTLEIDAKYSEIARVNIANASLTNLVEFRVGRAIDTLPRLMAERRGPFDLIFIDADKENIPEYFTWSVKLARPGSLIVVDNVVRNGALADPTNSDPNVRGVRRFHEMLAMAKHVTATTIQTVGSKGYDGFTIALVAAR